MCMTNGNGYEAIETADITKTLPITPAHTHTLAYTSQGSDSERKIIKRTTMVVRIISVDTLWFSIDFVIE